MRYWSEGFSSPAKTPGPIWGGSDSPSAETGRLLSCRYVEYTRGASWLCSLTTTGTVVLSPWGQRGEYQEGPMQGKP